MKAHSSIMCAQKYIYNEKKKEKEEEKLRYNIQAMERER